MGCSSSKEAAIKTDAAPDAPNKDNTEITKKETVSADEKSPSKGTEAVTSPPANANCCGRVVLGETILRYACQSRKGRDPEDKAKPNQDCYGVHETLDEDGSFFAAVYDGHGPDGAPCSHFVKDKLPSLIKRSIKLLGKKSSQLSSHEAHYALSQAHIDCNDDLHACSSINDKYSGTTAISLYLSAAGQSITVSNVGDSRAVMGAEMQSNCVAVPLSKDQTPHRAEEAKRCQQNGARILSMGQIDPSTRQEGEEDVEDPPRVWAAKGMFPGTAFTRSLGDSVAETLGVFAEPEQMTLKLSASSKLLVLASDGIYDVLDNQQVVSLCYQYFNKGPEEACKALIEKSHHAWLCQEECLDDEEAASYDDMTAIVVFFGDADEAAVTSNVDGSEKEQAESKEEEMGDKMEQRHRRRRQKTLHNLEEWAEGDTAGE